MKATIGNVSVFAVDQLTESNPGMFRFLERHNPTDYDRIMDAVYRETHIGGGQHRIYDGSHTFSGSYAVIKNKFGEVDGFEYVKAQVNELVTPEGIPLFNLDKIHFQHLTDEIAAILGNSITPGQIRAFIRDMDSFNAGELLSATLGSVVLAGAIKSGDPRAISRTVAINLCVGLYTANPLQLLAGLSGLAYGCYHKKISAWEMFKGSIPTVTGIAVNKVVGDPFIAIVAAIGIAKVMEHLDSKKRKQIIEELGNSQFYYSVMNPNFLSNQLERVAMRLPKLTVAF